MSAFEKKFAEFTSQVNLQMEAAEIIKVEESGENQESRQKENELFSITELQRSYRVQEANLDELGGGGGLDEPQRQ